MPAQPRQHSPTTACEHRIAPGLEGKLPPLPCWHRPGTGGTGQERGAAGLHFPPPKCHFPAGRSKTPSHTLNAPPNTQHSLPKTAFPTAKEDLALQSLQHLGFYSSFILFYLFFFAVLQLQPGSIPGVIPDFRAAEAGGWILLRPRGAAHARCAHCLASYRRGWGLKGARRGWGTKEPPEPPPRPLQHVPNKDVAQQATQSF